MSLVSASLKRPVTVLVVIAAVFFSSILAIKTIPIDIFPKLNLPVIYVIEPYGGMTPEQMEGFFSTRLQDQFLYVWCPSYANNRKIRLSPQVQWLSRLIF